MIDSRRFHFKLLSNEGALNLLRHLLLVLSNRRLVTGDQVFHFSMFEVFCECFWIVPTILDSHSLKAVPDTAPIYHHIQGWIKSVDKRLGLSDSLRMKWLLDRNVDMMCFLQWYWDFVWTCQTGESSDRILVKEHWVTIRLEKVLAYSYSVHSWLISFWQVTPSPSHQHNTGRC